MTSASATRSFTGRTALRYLLAVLATGITYFAVAKLGLQLASINASATPIWPATGLAIAALLLGGYGLAPAVFAAALAANLTTTGTLYTASAIAFGNTAEALLGAWLTVVWTGVRNPFASPSGVLKFAAVSGLATAASASVGVATLYEAHLASWTNLNSIWLTWWLGDLAGALVVTPPIVLWARYRQEDLTEPRMADALVGMAGTVAVGAVAFSPLIEPGFYREPLTFLAIIPLVWTALRVGPRDTATAAVVLSAFAVWGALMNGGPFARATINDTFLMLVMFMITTSLPSLALSADAQVRRRTETDLRKMQAALDDTIRARTEALASANAQLTKSNEQLYDSNALLREAQRLADVGSFIWDIPANRLTWSDQLFAIYGQKREDFGGTPADFFKHVHPDDRETVRKNNEKILASGSSFRGEERIVRPNGDVRYLQTIGEVVRDENGAPVRVIGVCRDMTDNRRIESALRESEQNYRLLVRGVHDYAIYMLDTHGRVRNWNIGAERIKQYSAQEIVGQHFSRFYTEEERARDLPNVALETAIREGRYEAQGLRVRKDGTTFFANVVIDAIRDDDGNLIGFAKITRDITEQREAQVALEYSREQLAQAQKMEALGQLTGGIAHDFNNLLMIMGGHAQLLQRRLTEAKDLQAIDAIRAAAGRGEKLTRQLLAFSRRQTLTPVVVDLRARIGAVREMLSASLRGNIELALDVQDDIWSVEADLGELELALVNVAVNARDAMPEGGKITVSARNVVLKAGSAAGPLEGDFVALAVIDTGTGMSPDVMKRVFEPFYTTKPVGKGTGLGLSQVHGFTQQSGGAVTVDSTEGEGTVVTMYLPRSTAVLSDEPAKSASSDPRKLGTILMVEDSREVAEVTSTLLEQLGYRVVRAENAAEALRHLSQGIDFDLLFSDIVMPGQLNGFALAKECAERYPGIPILLTSGYNDAAQAAEHDFPILRKPYDMAALEEAVAASLKEKAPPEGGARLS
ncbi:MAG: MASE1 domain-containing protein [Pseudolabrys sp.]|nr:MASE1 domain-containing protein [Pseudolabrys sp.]